jgi:hypothetical protein
MENKKSFWQRPEGKMGFLLLAGLIGGGGWLIYKMLPSIINLLQNSLIATGLGIALFAVIYVLLDPKFRTSIWYLYKMSMRWLTGWIVTIDPIALLKVFIEDLQTKKKNMEVQLTELKGQLGVIKQKVSDKKGELEKQAGLARAAQAKGRDAEVKLYSTQVARLETHISRLQNLVNRMDVLYNILEKMRYYSDIMILNTKNEVEIREDEYKTIRKSHSVMKSAMSIINGSDDKKMMFDEAMEYVVEDIGSKIGEMDRMLDASAQFINTVDLEDDVYSEKGLKFIEDLEKRGIDNIFGETKQVTQGTTKTPINFNIPTPVVVNKTEDKKEAGDYKSYF